MREAQPRDLVIAGGGMVGLTVASALGQRGLSVVVVDPHPQSTDVDDLCWDVDVPFDDRVSALTPASQNILNAVDAWPLMEQMRVAPYRSMAVWDGEGTAQIRFEAQELHRPQLGHIVENRVTVAALNTVLRQLPTVELIGGERISAISGVSASADGYLSRELALSDGSLLQTRLLVIADGARSQTRALAGMTVDEWDYEHHAVVATLELAAAHQNTAWQRFTEDGPLALLPLPMLKDGVHRVSMVWSTSPQHAEQLLQMEDDEFCHAVTQGCESVPGQVVACGKRQAFPLTQRHAPQYVEDGIALVGDAAHTIHPLAGQGVNLGLMDAATLAEEVVLASERGADFASLRRLRRYQRRRRTDNSIMIGSMAAFRHLYGEVPPPVQLLRNWGLRQVAGQLPLRQLLANAATGLTGDLPALARNT